MRGVVDEVTPTELTLTHEAVPDLKWPGMTMPFKLANPELAKALKPEQQVQVHLPAARQGLCDHRRGKDQAMIARLIRWSVANRFLVLLATVMLTAWGVWGVRSTPVDALPGPVGCPGHHPHLLSRSGAADCGEPGHLPVVHHHAVRPGRQDGARLLVLWRLFRLHPV